MNNVPGADDLGWGFDVFGKYGDSSLKTKLFQMTGGRTWTDPISGTNYNLPLNVGLSLVEKNDSTSQVFDTATEVQEYFAAKASLEASYVGEFGAFTGAFNSAYQKSTQKISLYKYALFESENIAWRLTLESQSLPELTTEVQGEVAALPEEFSQATRVAFFRFIRKYGTHYVSRVAVGGRLYYYVSVEKSFLSDDTKIDANVTLEFNAVLVSAQAESKVEWSRLGTSWAANRSVHVEAVGGTPDSLLLAAPEYDDNRSAIFKQWVDSIKASPATMDFELRPISNLMPANKSAAMDAALRAYFSDNLLVVEARSRVLSYPQPPKPEDLPVVTLGESIRPTNPPQFDNGFLMIILKPVEDDFEVYLIGYYSVNLYSAQERYTSVFDAMLADLREGNYTQSGYLLVLASFDWDWQAAPTSDFYAFLRSAGAGRLLEEWDRDVVHKGSISGLNSLYILIGATGSGPNLGVEALGKSGPELDPISSIVSVRLQGLNLQPVNISDAAKRERLEARTPGMVS